MERRTFQTSEGEVWVWGYAADFEGSDPLILTITGAFAAQTAARPWRDVLGLPILVADLPGNHCPWLRSQTPKAYETAFSEVVAHLGRAVSLCGISAGGLVALGVYAPNLCWTLALDPLLSSEGSAHTVAALHQERERAPSAELDEFLMSFFGIAADGSQHSLSHRSELLERRTPAWIMGADKIPPIPGILSESDVQAIRSAAGVRYTFVQGAGHQIALAAPSVIFSTLRELFASMALRKTSSVDQNLTADRLANILFDELKVVLSSKRLWSEYSTEEKAPWLSAARKVIAKLNKI